MTEAKNMPRITLITCPHNEETRLKGLIRNTAHVVDEIIVVAVQCTDGTVKVARKNGARIIYSNNRISEANAKKGMAQAKTEWILLMDPDERLSEGLKEEIKAAKDSTDADAYLIRRVNFMLDGFAPEKLPINQDVTRFFRRGHLLMKGIQHEHPKYLGRVKRLNEHMLHYSLMSIPEIYAKGGFYAFETQDLLEAQGRGGEMPSMRDKRIRFLFGAHGFRKMFILPIFWFFNYLFGHRTIFAGYRGIVIAAMASFCVFLEEAYHWEKQSKRKKGISIDWNSEYPERPR